MKRDSQRKRWVYECCVRKRRHGSLHFVRQSGVLWATLKVFFGVACLSTPGDLPPHPAEIFSNSQCWCWWFRWCEGYPGRFRPDCREIRCAFYSLACRPRNMIMRCAAPHRIGGKKSNSQFVNFHCKIRTSPVTRWVCFFRGWRCIALCAVWRNVT